MALNDEVTRLPQAVAVIGMAGRFPGAADVRRFWENQRNGVEGISSFSVEELETADGAELAKDPRYVRARSVLDHAEEFDAAFFGILPKEAELMDPQQRIFLECCWEALEDAGYDPMATPGLASVYAGSSPSTYFLRQVCSEPRFIEKFVDGYQVANYPALLGSNTDFLATRVSYKLNLKGAAFTMMAGCSTSLVAVTQASGALQSFQCDMALAGGVSITFPQKRGYMYQEGGMVSPDGHCRAFDEQANGTVFGGGCGVVVLKRLSEALQDGDHVLAVIRGYAVNNDGSSKVGFTAPSVEGQANVIAMAQAAAEVSPETIGYVEAHGTGTPLGDPIEVAALTQAFRAGTEARQFCALGTAKTNVGHLDIAAGVTGLINAIQILRHKTLPATLNFRKANPKLNLETSPFYVSGERREWKSVGAPRRAGVSAFGVGGTNAHVILEEAPEVEASFSKRDAKLLLLSAKSAAALDHASQNLAADLEAEPGLPLADVAYTLQTGRHEFERRRFVVASDRGVAVKSLLAASGPGFAKGAEPGAPTASAGGSRGKSFGTVAGDTQVVFMFPGQGAQYLQMGAGLYQAEAEYRNWIDKGTEILLLLLGRDLRQVMFADSGDLEEAKRTLTSTGWAQPAIFLTEFALAKLWMSWGIQPAAMIGHSVGEFTAACLAGVFSFEDGLQLVATRGRMMQELAAGSMLAVRLPEVEVQQRLRGAAELSLAAVNSPGLCVVAGPSAAVDDFEKSLNESGVAARRLHTSHAFHSAMMDGVVEPFAEVVKTVQLSAAAIPLVSCVSGSWATREQMTNPRYWAMHLRQPVRFADGMTTVFGLPNAVLLEVGPGATLTTLGMQHPGKKADQVITSSLPDAARAMADSEAMLNALGRLWTAGVSVDWKAFHGEERLRRVPLSTYPFERKRFWMERALPATPLSLPFNPANGFIAKEGNELMNASSAVDLSQPIVNHDRKPQLERRLAEMFQELSGINAADMDVSANFMELGFDSLFLTQATQELHTKFGVKVTFRQLLDQQSSIAALAAYLDSKLAPAPAVRVAALPVGGELAGSTSFAGEGARATSPAAAAAQSSIEAMMREQLRAMSELMARQLETLRAAGGSVPVATAQPEAVIPAASSGEKKDEPKAFGPYKPPVKGPAGGLTPQQERHIAQLIASYNRKTAKSKAYTQAHRKVMADPRVVSGFRAQWKDLVYPIVTERSEGSRLYDIDGNEYIDILNGFGPTVFGHKPEFVTAAVTEQMAKGFEIGPMSPLAGEVAEMISAMTGMARVAFTNTGSEAVLCAMRVARTVTGRNKIVMFTGDYHGMFDEVLVKAIKRPGAALRSAPIAPGIPPQAAENIIVLDYGSAESLEYIRTHASELAAVMVEPVQSRHPNLQPREFLQEIRSITTAAGTAFIFDEVVTGFRSHPGGAQAIFGIRADMATYGKIIGGGLPIGILTGSAEFLDALDGGMWQYGDESFPEVGVTFFAGTFVRHPLALAATRAVLQHLQAEGPQLQERLNAKTANMVARLNEFLERRQAPLRIENFASVFYFTFPADLRFGSLFYYHMREKGIHIQEGFPCFMTTAHSDADIDRIVNAFEESITEMQVDGMLPGVGDGVAAPARVLVAQVAGGEVVREAPLTEVQMEIWLAAQWSDEASLAYNESLTLYLHGTLDEAALREAIQEVVNRHDALRITFTATGDRQRFAQTMQVVVPLVDRSQAAAGDREQILREMKDNEARTPFDLVNGPVARFQMVRFSADEHALLFTAHHIACDGWSANVILDELSKLYSARLAKATAALDPALSFGAYATSHSGKSDSATQDYWVKQFAEIPADLDLPTDRPRPVVRSYAGATFRKQIDASAYKQIKSAGAKRGCTLFVTLLAGFEALLGRLSGQNDLVVGIPTAGQSLLEGQTLVGHCVNFLPLRARFAEGIKFSELLTQQKKSLLDAYEHQDFTYGTLVRALNLRRDSSRLPLMEVQFNLERVGGEGGFAGLRSEVDPNPKAFVNFDLFLNIVESDAGLTLDCDFNTGLYDQATVARWLDHYETLLLGFVGDSELSVDALPLLSPAERQRMVVEWNATEADYPRNRCVQELFEAQVERTPDATAVTFEGQRLSYAELNQRANQLAHHLQKVMTGPEAIVGIYVERSLEMMVALLGVMKAGAAYLPLDPGYPKERIDFIVGEAQVPVLLTQAHLAVTLPATTARIICLDTDWPLVARQASGKPASKATAESLAYVIYTSGSTGKPKGVEISHRAVVNLLTAMARVPGMDSSDIMLAVTTLSFDIAALELFLPLIVGGQLVIASREVAADPVQLMERLQRHRATIMQATPITWRMLLDAGWDGRPLRKILCGGEALPQELGERLLQLPAFSGVNPAATLWNMYGPTETTIWSATSQVQRGAKIAIGPPIDNTQFYIVDGRNQSQPIGVPGELCIAGDGVARGYHQRPELTAERFVANPFRPGTRMYKTGDLARYLADGTVEFMGRLDHQIKLRGYRIELGEIESVLEKHTEVRQAVATVREDAPGDQRLVAYVVAKNGSMPGAAELRKFAGEKLPDYMVPSLFVGLSELPLTANGKIDRKALPKPGMQVAAPDKDYAAPRTALEKTLAEIWSEVLKVPQVGVEDSILELGADSIHIFQITARANASGIRMTAKQLLQARTISQLSNMLGGSDSGAGSAPPRIKRVAREAYRAEVTR